jgi:hypothetical protein
MKLSSFFFWVLFYLICITVSGQRNTYNEKVIEFEKIKNGKITYCDIGDKIKLVTILSDTVFKAKIKDIHMDYLTIEIIHKHHSVTKQYHLNEIKSIEKETVIYKILGNSASFCFLMGTSFFITGDGEFNNYALGAGCYVTGVALAISTISLRRKYTLNVTHFAAIRSVKAKTRK